MCSCAPRPTSPDLATSPRSRCTSHTYQISPYLPLTSARCAPRPTRTTFCSGSPRPAEESGGEMRLRAAGPHFCACVRSFRGCALRGARHEAPSPRLLCVIGLSRVRNEKEFRAATARSNRVWLPWFNTHILYGATGTQHTFANAPKLARHTLNTVRCAARRHPRGTSLYCTLAARRGRSSSLEVEVRELDAAAGGRSEGLLAQSSSKPPRSPQAARTACLAESSSPLLTTLRAQRGGRVTRGRGHRSERWASVRGLPVRTGAL